MAPLRSPAGRTPPPRPPNERAGDSQPRAFATGLTLACALASMTATACIQTIAVQTKALPDLADQAEQYPEGFYDTKNPRGKPILIKGSLLGVDVERKDGSIQHFSAPLKVTAAEKSDRITVSDRQSTEEIAWTEIRSVTVDATNPRGKRIGLGAALLSLGVPFTVGGVIALSVGLSGNLTLPENKEAVGAGAGLLVAGAALTIPALFLIINPPSDPRKRDPYFPTLKIRASAAGLQGSF